jgi:hypothetical protein
MAITAQLASPANFHGHSPAAPAYYVEISAKLAHAQATIQNMERSWFWRARLNWVRVRNLIEGDRRQREES